ncbi:hypothetical protein Gpo141_00001590 [Globisporangium polare]
MTTPYDFVFTLVLRVGIYHGLGSWISLSDTREVTVKKKPTIPPICVRYTLQKASGKSKILESRSSSSGPSRRMLTRLGTSRTVNARIGTTAKTRLHFLFAFWGVIILFLHLGSFISYTTKQDGYSQRVWPWITQKLPCSVFEYNCYHHNTSTVPEDAFQDLENRVL